MTSQHKVLFVVALCLAWAGFAHAQALTVGGVTAQPGEKASGYIEVPDAGDAGTRIPVSVVHGAHPGPVLALVAGTHGYEYPPILALARVRERLDPQRMRGSVILVHVANPPTFWGRRIYYGPDGKNLNRMFPGKADGTQSERIAFALTREVIDKATHLADMHCGDGNESLRPYSYWMISGDGKVDAASREMTLAFGLPHIVVDRERPSDPSKSAYTANTAILRGKPAVTTEMGFLGRADEAATDANVRGALSLAAHLGIQEAPSARVERPLWIVRSEVLRAPVTGLWQPVVDQKDSVATGALIGRISDPFGKVLAEVRAPFGGEMLYVVATPPVERGEPLGFVGQIVEGGPEGPATQ